MGSVSEPFVFVDGPRPSEAEHIYDHYFSDYPTQGYDQILVQQIQSRRSSPNCQGSLFFDNLLNLALQSSSIDDGNGNGPSPFYPPQEGKEGLCDLIERISSSNFDRVRRTALIFYLILDLDAYHGVQASVLFAKQMAFPRSVREGMKGYWHLDNGQFRLGISYLEQPDFVPRIARVLSPLPSTSNNERDAQEKAFAFTSFLKLINLDILESEVDDIAEAITVSICWTQNIRAAWLYCRSMITMDGGEEEEKKMALCVARIVEFCFTPQPKPTSVKALIALPLTTPEEQMLADIIVNPPPNIQLSSLAHATAIDTLLVRYINSGQYIDAIILDRKVNSSLGLMQVNQDASGSEKDRQKARSLREKRQALVKAAYSVLTRIERMMLELGDDFAEAQAEEEEEAQGLEGSWERVTPMADSTIQSIRSERPTFAGPSTQRLTALTASPSLRSPAEPGSERSIDPLLTEVVRSSPARLRSRVSALGGSPRAGNVSLGGASNMDTGSPRSHSFIGSPSIRRSESIRKSIHSRQGTPSRSNAIPMSEDVSFSMPLSSAKPYQLQSQPKDAQNEMDHSFSNRANTIGPDVGESSLISETQEATGPLSRLAQELEEEMRRNQGSVDEILRRSITTNSMSPFRVISGSNRAAHSTLRSNKPVRRYEARYEIGSSRANQEQDKGMRGKGDIEQEVQEPVKRRGGRTLNSRQRVPRSVSRVNHDNVEDDGDTSVPGSFPGMQEDPPAKGDEQVQEAPKRATRRNTKTQKKKQQDDEDEDVVPEMEEVSTAIRKSRSAASNLVGRPKASTPLRRSARLSVEPDAVHEDVISPTPKSRSNPTRQRSQRSASPTKKASTANQSTRKRRGASQAPTEPSEDENDGEEQGIATRSSRRRAAASGMPGGF